MNLSSLNEFSQLNTFLKTFPRHPKQSNSFFQSDAEVIELSSNSFLSISLDIVGDEQAWGLIQDPSNLGQHALESALSDLAAVGVVPKGFLNSLIIGKNQSEQHLEEILKGLNQVCLKHGLYLFGGDTASGESFSLHLTVVVIQPTNHFLVRDSLPVTKSTPLN